MNTPSKPTASKKWVKPALASLALVGLFLAAKTYLERPVMIKAQKTGIVVKTPAGETRIVAGAPIRIGKEHTVKQSETTTYHFWKMTDGSVEGKITEKEGLEPATTICDYAITPDGTFRAKMKGRFLGEQEYEVRPDGTIKRTDPSVNLMVFTYIPNDLRQTLVGIRNNAQKFGAKTP